MYKNLFSKPKGLSSWDIERYFEGDKQFKGCFSQDKLPKNFSFPMKIIINTDKSDSEGDHWVALRMDKNGAYFFDSFGLPIIETNIYNFVKKFHKSAIYSKKCIQHFSSSSCGLFCIAFLNETKDQKSFLQFLEKFNPIYLQNNDSIVKSIILSK